jgi:hypothetical protein
MSTQTRHPWRTTARTVFQFIVALATLLPFIVTDVYSSADAVPAAVGQVLAVAAGVTRLMANPAVEDFLAKYFPWLAAEKSA